MATRTKLTADCSHLGVPLPYSPRSMSSSHGAGGPAGISSVAVLTCLLCLAFPSAAQTPRIPAEYRAAPRSLVTQPLDPASLADLPGAMHSSLARAQDLGAVPGSLPLEHIQLVLRRTPERQAAFDSMVQALNQPGSPSFHQWLTPDEVGSAFGPSASDLAAVTAYLQAQGFTVNRVGHAGTYIDFSGTAATAREAFRTEIHTFRLPSDATSAKPHYAAAQPARIPSALAPVIAGLVSLSDISPHPMRRAIPASRLTPAYTSGGSQLVGAQDFYTIYNELPLLTASTPINGSGQTIALLEETDIVPNDVTVFRSTFGVTPATPALTVAHGSASVPCTAPGITSKDEESEAVLDTEWSGAAAPSANLLFMACASTNSTGGIFLSAEAVIEDNLASVMSLSYGATENKNTSLGTFISQLWEQAAAQGQTVVVSSGDSGSDVESDGDAIAGNGLNVNVLASSAYNISAGGTDFQDGYNVGIDPPTAFGPSAYWSGTNGPGNLTAKSYVAETTWNGSCASSLLSYDVERSTSPTALCDDSSKNTYDLAPDAGSGGASTLHARPGWQTGTVFGLPTTASYSGRLQPDISLFASNYVWGHALSFYQSDEGTSLGSAGGTSFVAPQLAGVFALIAQKTSSRLGLANVQLYNLAGNQFGTTSFLGAPCNGSGASGIGETATVPSVSCVFYDIQTGNNSDACTAGSANCYSDAGQTYGILSTSTTASLPAYTAGQGYDMATGIGSLNIANLVNNWANTTLAASSTKLSLSSTTFNLGASVTFSITVTSATGTGTPTGSAAVVSASTFVYAADATLANGGGSASTGNFPGGTYPVYARYLGDGAFAPSSSTPITITVNPHATTTTLAARSSAGGNIYGSTVTLSATLSPLTSDNFNATGSITFYDNSTAICTAVAYNASGVATCKTPALTVGTHTFKAVYSGDSDFAPSTSATTSISVTAATPTVTVSPVTVTYGTAVATLTASIAFTGPSAPTGAVTFTVDSGSSLAATCAGTTTPITCTASASLASLNAGTHTIAATVATDINYTAASGTGTGTLTITPATPAITFTVPDHHYGDAPFTAAASSNSSGSITYSVLSGPAAVSGSTVTLTGSGTVVLQGAQAAAGNYAAATVTTSFSVTSAASVWLGNSNSSLSVFSTSGTPLSPSSGYTGGGLGAIPAPVGVAFDHAGNLWIANSAGGVSEFAHTGSPVTATPYTGGGINAPLALALDGFSQVWIANRNGTVSLLANSGTAISPATGYTSLGLSTPGGIAIDLSGNVWIANTSDNSVTEIIGAAAPVAPLATAVTNGTTGLRP